MHAHNVDPKKIIQILHKEEELEPSLAKAVYKKIKNGGDAFDECTAAGVREDAFIYAVSQILGVEMASLEGTVLPDPIIEMVPVNVANSYRIIPIRKDGEALVVATADPDNLSALDDLKFMLNVEQIMPALTSDETIDRALEQYYHVEEIDSDLAELLGSHEEEDFNEASKAAGDLEVFSISEGTDDKLGNVAESEAIRKLLNLILLTAVKAEAADVHLEPFEEKFQVRNRIDGVLYDMMPVQKELAPSLIARVKVMSNLDISERRLPQDGKISINIGNRLIDLRVSTLPTMYGESVVIRILDRGVVSLDLDKIGMPDSLLDPFRDLIVQPNGIVIVTGPTGSGKTTTLYAALNEVNEESIKIITTEDPVEYEIDGLVQVPIEEDIGKTFAACLRSILRQDPDKILVGEVRDQETAKIAIEAALTGHLVFTTLHTNDAPTAITRLLDMGLEPFLLSATLEAILAQRLVRTVCLNCKTPYEPSEEELLMLGLTPDKIAGQQFYYGKGCDHCKQTGYRGRTALFEMLVLSDRIRELVLENASSAKIRAAAEHAGMVNLRESGIARIFAGVTTIEEVVRETIAADEV